MNVNVNLPKMDIWFKQHGNAKNADVRRLTNLLNNTFIKERWYVLFLLSLVIIYKTYKEEARKDAKCKAEIEQSIKKEGEVIYEII